MADDSFKQFVLDQLSAFPDLRVRAMFGAFGVYQGEHFFAVIDGGKLYFKTDPQTARRYVERHMPALTYKARNKTVALGFHEVPPDVLENVRELEEWAQEAIRLAIRKKM